MNCMSDIDITDYMSLILDYIMKIRCFQNKFLEIYFDCFSFII